MWKQGVAGTKQQARETSQAARLFARHVNGEQLSEAELARMWTQVRETGKALVAATLVGVVPGGTVLLPLLEKLMPEGTSLIPAAFRKPPPASSTEGSQQ